MSQKRLSLISLSLASTLSLVVACATKPPTATVPTPTPIASNGNFDPNSVPDPNATDDPYVYPSDEPTPDPTDDPFASPTPDAGETPLPGESALPTAFPTVAPSATPIPSPTPTATPTATPTPSPTATPSPDTVGNALVGTIGSGKLNLPVGVEVKNGKVYVADVYPGILSFGKSGRVRVFQSGAIIKDVSGGLSTNISGVAVAGNNVYVADNNTNADKRGFYRFDEGANQFLSFYKALSASYTQDIAVDSEGNFYVADSGLQNVSRWSANGSLVAAYYLGSSNLNPVGVAVDSNDNLYVTASTNNSSRLEVRKYNKPSDTNTAPSLQLSFDGKGTDSSKQGKTFNAIGDVAVDPRNGDIFVVDTGSISISRYDKAGKFIRSFGSSDLMTPESIAIAPDGSIYVADKGKNAVVQFAPSP